MNLYVRTVLPTYQYIYLNIDTADNLDFVSLRYPFVVALLIDLPVL